MLPESPRISLPATGLPLVVVAGAGFAGLEFIRHLPADRFCVLLLDRDNHHTFQPLLYQVAIGGLEPDSVAYPIRSIFSGRRNFYFRMAEVTRVDVNARKLYSTAGWTGFDFLVLATGSRINFFGMKDIREHAFGLKTIPDALALRSLLLGNLEAALEATDDGERNALLTFVVAGGGPTGMETAGALAELKKHVFRRDYPELDLRKMQIYLVEAGDRLLAAMSERSQQAALRFVHRMGIQLRLRAPVTGYDGQHLRLGHGEVIRSRTVIWSAGVSGNAPSAFPEALVEGGRIRTDTLNRVHGMDGVFAIGDVAGMQTPQFPRGHPMLAPVAKQQGHHLARNLVRLISGKDMLPFTYKDKGVMATFGRAHATLDAGRLHLQGWPAWLCWLLIHLMYLVGFRNRIVVLVNWTWNYIRYDSALRIILRPFKKRNFDDSLPRE